MKNTPFQITEGLFDHMVVQRGGAAVFGGVCQSAGVVRVIVRRGSAVVRRAVVGRARAGKFTGRVPRVPAGGPYDFEVQLNGASVHVRDVLVGDVWLLGGQSNMQGCGRLRAAARPNSYVRAFYMEDRWAVARDPLHDMSRCVDAVHIELNGGNRPLANTLTGTGPGVAFGQELARRTGIPQGLIACAHGGTSMAQWDPARKADGGRSLYGALVRRLRKNGGAATGLVWYQGESDAGAEAAACYTEKMRDHANSIGRVVWYDDRLFRTGAMDPEVMDNLIEKWTRLEFDATEVVDGKVVWKDFCVITAYGQSEHLCPWIEVHPAGRAARHRGTELWKVKGRENL